MQPPSLTLAKDHILGCPWIGPSSDAPWLYNMPSGFLSQTLIFYLIIRTDLDSQSKLEVDLSSIFSISTTFLVCARTSFSSSKVAPERDRAQATTDYIWCGTFLLLAAGTGAACRWGRARVVPWMLLKGTVAANVGSLCARTCVAASNPEASLIRVGSLKAAPKKLMPSGTPKPMPAGTCTIGYPGPAARLDVPKIKWSP